jgi:hypothetical protein
LLALIGLAGLLLAEEPSVSGIVSTIRFHPTGVPAAVGLKMLSRKGEPGWQALSSLTIQLVGDHPGVAGAAARALAEGPETERLRVVARTYSRTDDDDVRAILAVGLAYGFDEHETLLLRHMRENRKGARDVLRILAPNVLPEQELRRYLSIADLAPVAYAALRARALTVRPEELLVWARAIAISCLDPATCRRWAQKEPDFTILSAVALVVAADDEDVRDGAHCLLLTVSGKKIQADRDLWRSWIAARRDRYERPEPLSAGEIAAAVVRGARFVRRDLLDDGRCLWARDTGGVHAIGSTSLAVMALRTAGYPADHPALEKALRTSMLVFGPGGAPALRPLKERGRETYVLSLLAIALCELDAKRYRVPLEALRKRIIGGMQPSGAWGYQCLSPTDQLKRGRPDNSCTQYAVLALRALRRSGFDVPRDTWQKVATHLYKGVNRSGGWNYHRGAAGVQVSMTSAGISSLAICIEALVGREAASRIQVDPALERARAYLGRLLMESGYGGVSSYAFYGVERACVLTATQGFRSKHRKLDWYRAGARHLLSTQGAPGSMHGPSDYYGPGLDTAYAILFLTRATRTVGAAKGAVIKVDLPPEKDKADPPPAPEPDPEPPPPPELRVEWDHIPTRSGEALIAGILKTAGATLSVDGKAVRPDVRGRFFVPVTITRNRTVPVVARDQHGLETRHDIVVAFDARPPRVRLMGPPRRHVGKQVLVFGSDEPLRALRVAGRVYPADGRVVRAAVEVGEGERTLAWVATDRAGNEGRSNGTIEARNRHLVLDGASAVGIDLRSRPQPLTVECWVRGDAPNKAGSVVANTESSGFGLIWASRRFNFPHGLVRVGRTYAAAGAKRPWKWEFWTHLALVHDGKSARFFVNGKLQGETAADGPRALSSRRLYVGAEPDRHGNPSDFFKGSIDEVRVSGAVRYTGDFRPRRAFMRDDKTLVLLHFDRDTLAAGILLDDSGKHHHARPHGQPALSPAEPGGVLEHARKEMRGELPPMEPIPLTPAQRAAQNEWARAEATRHLGLVATTVRVVSPNGVPYPGLAVYGLHESLDVSTGPAGTDAAGDVTLRLPRGAWRVDFVTGEPKAGRVVFARARFAVRDGGREVVTLDRKRDVQFRTRRGELRAAHAVTLAWPDFSFHRRVEAAGGRIEILTAGDAPMVVQAVRRPDEAGGYILRHAVGPGKTTIETDPEQATVHTFRGKGARRLDVRYTSADALPIDFSFASKERRTVRMAGLPEIVLHLESEHAGRRFRFYPRPYLLDGNEREYTGAPKFDIGVGFVRNWRAKYTHRINSISFRVFCTTKSGLLLHPDGPYSVAWEQVLDRKVRHAGKTKPAQGVWTSPLDPKQVPNLRYRLQVRGAGVNRKLEVQAFEQTAAVHVGKVRTWCFPAVQANARHWAACVDRAIRAYELTCPHRKGRVDIERSIHMPLPIIGMGGYAGSNGWMWLPEQSLYGFWGTWYWTGLLSHELGHVFHYGHANPMQSRVMRQAGRRAGRKLRSIQPGMERYPEGNRYRALLEAVTRGDVRFGSAFRDDGDDAGRKAVAGDATGDGVLVPNLELTGDDAVFWWYYRSQFGEKLEETRLKNAAAWSWLLTLEGFLDEEIQIAMLSRTAGTSLAWLARLRDTVVHDHRIAEAMERLRTSADRLVGPRERNAIMRRWRTRHFAPDADLEAEEARMRAELGHRYARVQAHIRIAREYLVRGQAARGEAAILNALREARKGGPAMLETALAEAAPYWTAR